MSLPYIGISNQLESRGLKIGIILIQMNRTIYQKRVAINNSLETNANVGKEHAFFDDLFYVFMSFMSFAFSLCIQSFFCYPFSSL